MMTSWSNEDISALLALCVRDPPVTGGFLSQKPVTWIFGVFFDLRLNKRLSKRSRYAGDLGRHRAHCDVIVMWFTLKVEAVFCLVHFLSIKEYIHVGPNKIADILQTFSNALSSNKNSILWFEFHWSSFLRVELTKNNIDITFQLHQTNYTASRQN